MSSNFRDSQEKEDAGEKIWARNGPPPTKRFRKRSRPPKLSEANQAYKEMLRWKERHQRLLHEQDSDTDTTRNDNVFPPSRSTLVLPKRNKNRVKSRTGPIARNEDTAISHNTEEQSNSNNINKHVDSILPVNSTNSAKDDRSLTGNNINITHQPMPPSSSDLQQHQRVLFSDVPVDYHYVTDNTPISTTRAESSENFGLPRKSYPSLAHQSNPTPIHQSNKAPFYQPNTTPIHQPNPIVEQQRESLDKRPKPRHSQLKMRPYLRQLPSENNEPFLIFTPKQRNEANTSTQVTSTSQTKSLVSHSHEPDASSQQVTTINPNNAIITSANTSNNNIPISRNNMPENEDLKVISFIPRNDAIVFDANITPDPLDAENHCRSCNLYLKKITDYRSHLRQVHKMIHLPSIKAYPPDRLPDPDDPKNYCRICKKKSKNNKDYKGHLRKAHFMNTVHERMPQTCFSLIIDENDPKNTSCKHCMMKFSDGDRFRRHMKRYHSNGRTKAVRGIMRVDPTIAPDPFDKNHYCMSCDMKWNVRENYWHHLVMMHNIETDDSVHEYYYCPIV